MEFTKASVAALTVPADRDEIIEWDTTLPGFGLRARRGGSKTWVCQYRVGGRQRRETLGDVRKVELADARKAAKQRFAKVELGIDPRAGQKAGLTLGATVKLYLAAKEDRQRPGTHVQAKLHLERYWKPLAGLGLDTITRGDVAAVLTTLTKDHGRTAATRARANLSACIAWAIMQGHTDKANPVTGTEDPAADILPRERVLDDAEIAAIWHACLDDDFGRIVRLLLLTGCRREEIGALMWDEFDPTAGTITIPGTRTKNGRMHTLPLPPLALSILNTLERKSAYVFPGRRGGKAGFNAWSYVTMALNTRITVARGKALPHWRIHDLRRTMRTGLARLGVPSEIAELCINHQKGGVQAIYDRHRYLAEIKAALAKWANHVALILDGKSANVVSLRV